VQEAAEQVVTSVGLQVALVAEEMVETALALAHQMEVREQ
jgi:hypothetical protein